MISDTLLDACDEIRRYLTDPVFATSYVEDRAEILAMHKAMHMLALKLGCLDFDAVLAERGYVPVGMPEEEL